MIEALGLCSHWYIKFYIFIKYLLVEVARKMAGILEMTKHLLVFSFPVQWKKLEN